MNEIYEKLENKRIDFIGNCKNTLKKAFLLFFGAFIAFLLFGASYLINNKFISFLFFIVMIILLIWGIIILEKNNEKQERFSIKLKIKLSNEILKKNFDRNYKYYANKKIDFDFINAAGLVRVPDAYLGKNLITGSYDGVNFMVSDVEFKELIVIGTENGTITKQETYFKGRWYIYEFEKNFNETLKIVENDVDIIKSKMEKFETEMIEFNNKFLIYSSNENFFYYLINPFLIERLMLLKQQHRYGTIYYCFEKNKLHIGINDYSNSLYIDIKRKIDENSMEIFNSDIVIIKKIIDEFNLSGNKFKN